MSDDNNIDPAEEWRDVVGFEKFYRVSNMGQVASCDRAKRDGGRQRKGRMLRQWHGKSGQPMVDFMVNGERFRFIVASVVANAFLTSNGGGTKVAHLDLDKKNNRADNLALMTHAEIMALTNKTLCEYEFISKCDMTADKVSDYLIYKDGDLFWRKRPALCVKIGAKAEFNNGDQKQVHLCGSTYMKSHLIYLLHFGVSPDYVLPKNGDFSDCRIENLYPCTASQWATVTNRVSNLAH